MSLDNRSRFVSAATRNPATYTFMTALTAFTAGLDFAHFKSATSPWDRYAFVPFLILALLLSYRLMQTINDLRDGRDATGKQQSL